MSHDHDCQRDCQRRISLEADLIRERAARVADKVAFQVEKAAAKLGVRSSATEDLHARIMGMGEWREDGGRLVLWENGLAKRTAAYDVITPDVAIRQMKPEAPHFFDDAEASPKDSAANPWRRDQWNLTEQGRVFRESPARARTLAAAAGATLPAMAE